MLLVQQFLLNHSFKQLEEIHGVSASFSKDHRKWSLNYSQIDTKDDDILAQECRGLILAKSDYSEIDPSNPQNIIPGETRVIAYPMNRFFNHGQGAAANIDLSSSNLWISNKLDGTLTILYWCPITESWQVATRSVPEADVPLGSYGYTFRTLFEEAVNKTLNLSLNEFTSNLDKNITYCFELTSPYNRIIVDYKDTKITLISARNVKYEYDNTTNSYIENFKEINIGKLFSDKFPLVETLNFKSLTISTIFEWVCKQNPIENEGVVVSIRELNGNNFPRIKVKNPAYVACNRTRDFMGKSERSALELILLEKEDDIISFLAPDLVEKIINLKTDLLNLCNRYDESFKEIKNLTNDRKQFALLLRERQIEWQHPFFSMYNGDIPNMKEYIMANKKDGSWANNFLDKILTNLKK